ncbi:MAG: PLP-dependent aminotransferase family protein [Ruminococcaceae bacterium]|nr:PLP-dependent aminotransferase family protein [Oscillospiraceae bacterium]
MNYTFSNKIANLKPSAIREILKAPATPDTISFAAGNPAPESFPVEDMARISASIYAESPTLALQYGATDGYTPLRDLIAKRQKAKFNIGKSIADGDAFDDTTMIVSGGQQGIELACKVFCNEGDAVICENPTFIGALNAFRSNGATPVGVTLEDDGMNIEELEETIKNTPNAKLIYVIPNFQNPAGICTSYEKRVRIYELAKKYGLMILEDNPYGELRFAGEDIPSIKSFDDEGIVIYCSTFSKILSAGMRVGFVIAPDTVASKMVVSKQTSDVHTNLFFQILCYRYMTECDLEGHIEDIRKIYRHKCNLMLECLERDMPECIKFTRPEGGLFIWGTLPDGIDANAFIKAATERNVRIVPGATFNCDTEAPSQSFRLNYSTPSDEQIIAGVKVLGELAREFV